MPTLKRILMVAFHFPPAAASSGIQRSLRFVQHLPSLGWEPVVLTAHARAHERINPGLLADVPPGLRVVSAFALDTARHLALAGRYPAFLARPDRWQLWRFGAVAAGLKLMRSTRFDALWSTYPIPTAHRIAADLHARTGVPWIADFRDPMAQEGYPADPKTWAQYQAIERHAIHTAARSVFTTPGAAAMYRARYPEVSPQRIVVIENGYDEETFAAAQGPVSATQIEAGPLVLLHSGVVYPSERDPTQLMAALAMLQARGTIHSSTFRLRFRASEHDAMLADLARRAGVNDLIELAPAIPYRDALGEMLRADALLVLQASNCNAQVPAKLYEYLRAGRPILALTDPVGDTAHVLARAGVPEVARLDSAQEIASLIAAFVGEPAQRQRWVGQEAQVRRASRRARAAELAALLDAVAAPTR
jgi:glycosyltransferase involved in cell wall biosynthesis